jgi:RpiB/LacA/LacB family sugar-phosphate isomerase
MKIAIASDHAGFPLKGEVCAYVAGQGHEIHDGAYNTEPSDYADFPVLVGKTLIAGTVERGIMICGSGVGVSIAANKMLGVRAGMCHDTYSAHQGVEHDDMNYSYVEHALSALRSPSSASMPISKPTSSRTRSASSADSTRSAPSKAIHALGCRRHT